jgi:hypothetical protein
VDCERLGHNPTVCLDTYHVIRELASAERISAEEQIVQVRDALEDDRSQGAQLSLIGP